MNQEELNHIKATAKLPLTFELIEEIERLYALSLELNNQLEATQIELECLQDENAAYQDYLSGKITLDQLEAALNKVEPIYQQKPVEEWVTGERETPDYYHCCEKHVSPASHSQANEGEK